MCMYLHASNLQTVNDFSSYQFRTNFTNTGILQFSIKKEMMKGEVRNIHNCHLINTFFEYQKLLWLGTDTTIIYIQQSKIALTD